jgi:hypothetical protein
MRSVITCLILIPLAAFVILTGVDTFAVKVIGSQPIPEAAEPEKPGHRFPDFGYLPHPSNYEGRVFKLSQDYPKTLPAANSIPEIATRDMENVKKEWKKYLLDAREYCFKGNVGADDVEDDWQVENNQQNKWFHMPWQHYGPNGREGIHGLTKEAPVQMRQLAWTQTHTGGQTYAVAFYNDFGGHTIGNVWEDHNRPATNQPMSFPIGTVVFKLLFVDVPPEQVPFLNPAITWQGFITTDYESTKRSIRNLSLVQMDLMVRHKSAPSGWLFGTFQYNGARPGANPKKGSWDNLVPLGLQWGNDPNVTENTSNPTPVRTIINPQIKESVINDDPKELPPTHLGWNGRLTGPLDNPMSSCMSCHLTAESPQQTQNSPMFELNPPTPGSKEWMRWFQNPKYGEKFDEKPMSTDFSLQMAIALQNFRNWQGEGARPLLSQYKSKNVPARDNSIAGPLNLKPRLVPPDPDIKIQRDFRP